MVNSFDAKDVRILRETLARLSRSEIRAVAVDAGRSLIEFARAVHEYCPHSELVFVAAQNANACLFCGTRFQVTEQLSLPFEGERK